MLCAIYFYVLAVIIIAIGISVTTRKRLLLGWGGGIYIQYINPPSPLFLLRGRGVRLV